MSDETDTDDKPHEPTAKKLEDARKKGELPRSADMTAAASYGGLLLAGVAFGAWCLLEMGGTMATLLDQADSLSKTWFEGSAEPLSAELGVTLLPPLLIWFGIPALAALLAVIAQRAFVVAPEKLKPKLNKISPISNAKNKFGATGLVEFAKSFAKLSTYSIALGVFLWLRLPEIIATAKQPPQIALAVLARLSLGFLGIVLTVAVVIGLIDLVWQHQNHLRKNRMSRKEIMDETKQSEGDPHMKQQRRQRGYDIAMNQMLADVPGADVVVVNPEHYAVALKWSRLPGAAPECVAKGVDEIAARIREAAAEAGVPIHRDAPTARALYATVEIGQEIAPEFYQAVAAAIRFSEEMRAKARARGR